MSPELFADLNNWIGRSEHAIDHCSLILARRIAAMLDRDPETVNAGDPLPPGWQMALFTPLIRQSDLRDDGHAQAEALIPPVPLPRRMLGGRRSWFHLPIPIGAAVERQSEIVAIEPKQGRSGALILVTLRHTIRCTGETEAAIIEEQDSIFREEASGGPAKPQPASRPASAGPLRPEFATTLVTDPRLLFRYSAIGFNTHRIHYDQPYATGNEGYPGLIVNGGLATLLLIDLFEREVGRPVASIETRNKGAIICGRPVRLCGAAEPDAPGHWRLWIENEDSRILLEAKST
ncbi:MAG: acyl-CoA dehydrogenase [Maritimibacter sp.]|nr:acyl-CoA dehydrogenase [Maritimibacter sp.]